MKKSSVFRILFELPDAEVYSIKDKASKLIARGSLQVADNHKWKSVFLVVNEFKYSLTKDIPILSATTHGHPSFSFPSVDGTYVIIIKGEVDPETLSEFETFLDQHSSYRKEAEAAPTGTVSKVANVVTAAGNAAKNLLLASANLIGIGISKGGDLIKDHVTPKEETKVSSGVKTGVKAAKETTDFFLVYTNVQIQGLIETRNMILNAIRSRWSNSETGQMLESSTVFQTAKEIGVSTVQAVTTIYDGLIDAIHIVGRSIGDATVKVVEKKYGKEVGQLTKDGVDTVENVGLVTKAHKEVIKAVVSGVPPHIEKAPKI